MFTTQKVDCARRHHPGRVLRYAAVALFAAACLAACAKTPPEEALRAQVVALQQSLESRDANAMTALDDDFVGPDGMDRRAARRMATVLLLRQQNVGITIGPLDVRLQGDDRAIVRAPVAVTGGAGGLLPDRAQGYQVETGWRLRGDDWRVISISWDPILR